MYKLSIIVPIYNAENELKNTLDSIINQTMDLNDIEVIMVNDCSTDNSKQIIEEYCQKYDNFKSIHLDENTGSPSIPRNVGIKNASSEYILFLDADDTLVETACDFLYDTITGEDVDLVSGYLYELDENGQEYIFTYWWTKIIDDDKFPYRKMKEILESEELYKFQFDDIHQSPRWILDYGFYNKIYKKSLILENDIYFPNIDGAEDAVFLFNYLLHSKGIIFANRPVTLYNLHREGSLSKSKSLKTLSIRMKAYWSMYDLALENDFKEEFVKVLLSAKLQYWLRAHVFNAFHLLNDEITDVLKDNKFLFDECIKYDADFYDEYYEIVKCIYDGDYEEAIRMINQKRAENSGFSNSFIISADDENQVRDILDSNFNFENSELIFADSDVSEDLVKEVPDEFNVKFLPAGQNFRKEAIENSLGRNIIFIDSKSQLNDTTYKLSKIRINNDLDFAFAHDSDKNINSEELKGDDCLSIIYEREFLQNELQDCEGDLLNDALKKSYNFRAIDINSLDEIYSNQENCKVSVIMPVYNAERYLEESIDCILNQSLRDIELICVDDGSEDRSLDILQKVAEEDKRMHFYCQNHSGGGAARNFALNKATGKYLYFMDSDDLIKLNALEELYGKIEATTVDFVICQSVVYDSDKDEYINRPYFDMEQIYNIVGDEVFHYRDLGTKVTSFSVTPWGKLFNREFALSTGARFGEGLIFHDHFFFWEVLFNSEKILFYKKQLCIYRIHSKSSTESKDHRFVNIFDVYRGIFAIFMKYDEFYNHERSIYNIIISSSLNRYFRIKSEFQPAFFDKMKEFFTELNADERYKNLQKSVYESYRIILSSILESDNNVEFNIHLVDVLGRNVNYLKKENGNLKRKNSKLKRKNRKLKKNYNEILSSSSWKLTSPLRKIKNFRK